MATKKKGESIKDRWRETPNQIKSSPNRQVTQKEKDRGQEELEKFLKARAKAKKK